MILGTEMLSFKESFKEFHSISTQISEKNELYA